MKHSARLSRGAALIAAATLVAAGAGTAVASTASASTVTPAAAARLAALRPVFSAVPFTSATVTVTVTSGALSVTWSASHLVGGVAVFAG